MAGWPRTFAGRRKAARATRTVPAGTSLGSLGCIDVDTLPVRQRRPSRPQPGR